MKKLFTVLFVLQAFYTNAQMYDTLNFEGTPMLISLDSMNGVWQVGPPQKTLFDSAYSSPNAAITDTLNSYPDNSLSYLYITIPINGFSIAYSLNFKFRIDTEAGVDGGYIEAFDCTSNQWNNVLNVQYVCPVYGMYFNQNSPTTLLVNGEYGYSGTSTGWENVEIYFPCQALFQNENERGSFEIKLRFAFVSDGNNTNQEGWMIDDVVFTEYLGVCSSIPEYSNKIDIDVFPNPAENLIHFSSTSTNFNFSRLEIIDLSGKIIYSTILKDNKQSIDVSSFDSGIYFYRISNENETLARGKFVRE